MNNTDMDDIYISFKKYNNLGYIVINFNKTINNNILDIFDEDLPNFYVINFNIMNEKRTIALKQLTSCEVNRSLFDPATNIFSKITFFDEFDETYSDMNINFLCPVNYLDEEKINRLCLFKYRQLIDFNLNRKTFIIYLD